jgi:hypothetical protein
MSGAETEEDWYSLQHIKGGNAHETTALRAKMIRDLKQEVACYASEDHPENPVWDCKEQIMKYCWQDVEVLRLGCQQYREMFMTVRPSGRCGWKPTPVDPFQYLTQSQVLQAWPLAGSEVEIARIPYKTVGRQSKIALSWLLEQQDKLREFFEDNSIQIRHAFNSYKEVIAEDGNRVDGYVEFHTAWEHEYKPSLRLQGYDLNMMTDIMGIGICSLEAT